MKKFIHISHPSSFISSLSICLFLLTGFLTACENDIEFTGEESKPLLVINSIIHAGQPIDVRVSRSIFFLDTTTTEYILADAVVNVSINGVSANLPYDADTQNYHDERIAHEGDHIVVTASHPTYGKATGETTVPHMPKNIVTTSVIPYGGWKDTQYIPDYIAMSRTDSVLQLNIKCDLPEDIHTYQLTLNAPACYFTFHCINEYSSYAFDFYVPYEEGEEEQQVGTTIPFNIPTTTRTLMSMDDTYYDDIFDDFDLDVSYDEHYIFGTEKFLFTDERLLSSASKALDFNVMLSTPQWLGGAEYYYDPSLEFCVDWGDVNNYGNPWDYLSNDFLCHFDVEFSALSEEYYKYQKSFLAYENTEIDIFSEPVQIYSNIQGGTGIVAALATQTTECNHRYSFPLNK